MQQLQRCLHHLGVGRVARQCVCRQCAAASRRSRQVRAPLRATTHLPHTHTIKHITLDSTEDLCSARTHHVTRQPWGFGFQKRRWRAAERGHPTDRESMGSLTLQTHQDPILLPPWLCFRGGGFPNPKHWPFSPTESEVIAHQAREQPQRALHGGALAAVALQHVSSLSGVCVWVSAPGT
jgi:hypothetical protein